LLVLSVFSLSFFLSDDEIEKRVNWIGLDEGRERVKAVEKNMGKKRKEPKLEGRFLLIVLYDTPYPIGRV